MNDTATAPAKAAREVEKVTMSDGREVEFVGKRKLLKETIIEGDGVAVRLDFRNGESILFPIPEAMLFQFAGHGAEQKLGDETAGTEDVDDMVLAVQELVDRLNKGEWSTRREGSGFAGTSVLLRALVEHSGRTVEQVKAFLTGKTQAEKMALRNSPKIKPIVDRLESEKLAKAGKVDTDALLAGLDS
jgi:hypothetical protein